MDTTQLRGQLSDHTMAMTRAKALAGRRSLPASGIYSWWFDSLADLVPHEGTVTTGEWAMLYIGISPGRASSKSNLSARLSQHLNLNAEGSTLRLTLGVLLADRLGLELRRVGSGKRMTFHCGEAKLNTWLDAHARVRVVGLDEPWLAEPNVIKAFSLPLNLHHNDHAFGPSLSGLRREAKGRARALPANPGCCSS